MTPTGRPACNLAYFEVRQSCPVCASTRVTMLYASPYSTDPVRSFVLSHYQRQGVVDQAYLEGTDFVVDACGDCDLVYQRHVPNRFLLDKVYNEMIAAESLFQRQMEILTLARFKRLTGEFMELFALLDKRPGEISMLDFGFGYGARARVAVGLGAKVYATEISPEKIAFAGDIGVTMIDAAALATMQFDIVHTDQVFEHLIDPRADFIKLAGCVAPGGIMKVAVPAAGNIRALLKSRGMSAVSPLETAWRTPAELRAARANAGYMCIVPMEHINVFTRKTIETLARETGLRLIGNVRKQSVPVSTASAGRFIGDLVELCRVAARVTLRSLLKQDSGYYILRRD